MGKETLLRFYLRALIPQSMKAKSKKVGPIALQNLKCDKTTIRAVAYPYDLAYEPQLVQDFKMGTSRNWTVRKSIFEKLCARRTQSEFELFHGYILHYFVVLVSFRHPYDFVLLDGLRTPSHFETPTSFFWYYKERLNSLQHQGG